MGTLQDVQVFVVVTGEIRGYREAFEIAAGERFDRVRERQRPIRAAPRSRHIKLAPALQLSRVQRVAALGGR
jgi:hypothetical protein